MSRESNRKKSVELKPDAPRPPRGSRIRREPPPRPQTALAKKLDRIDFSSPEWEVRLALAGIIFFALALTAVVFDIGEFLKLGM